MEKALAPKVVMPPCANNKAWNNKTISPTTDIEEAPKSKAPKATPVRCELLPATEGSLREDKTKTKAVATAKRALTWGVLVMIADSLR